MVRVLAWVVAIIGGLALLLAGFAWGIPGPVWGYAVSAQTPGIVMLLAAIPAAALAIISINVQQEGGSLAGDSMRSPERRTTLLCLGIPAWLILAGGYVSVAFDLAGPGREVHLAALPLSVPMLIGAACCVGFTVILLQDAIAPT
jgi:hypothetical protein